MNTKKATLLTTLFTALTACIFLYKKPIKETNAASETLQTGHYKIVIPIHDIEQEENQKIILFKPSEEHAGISATIAATDIFLAEDYYLEDVDVIYRFIWNEPIDDPTKNLEIGISDYEEQQEYIYVNLREDNDFTELTPNIQYIHIYFDVLKQGKAYYTDINNYIESYTPFIEPTTEVIDLPGLMLEILSMPFTFINTAFNVTIFPGTQYQINFANLFKGLLAILALLFVVKLFTKGLDAMGTINDNRSDRQWKKESRQMQREKHAKDMAKKD